MHKKASIAYYSIIILFLNSLHHQPISAHTNSSTAKVCATEIINHNMVNMQKPAMNSNAASNAKATRVEEDDIPLTEDLMVNTACSIACSLSMMKLLKELTLISHLQSQRLNKQ